MVKIHNYDNKILFLIADPTDHFRVDSKWEKFFFKFAITSRFDQNFNTVAIISPNTIAIW